MSIRTHLVIGLAAAVPLLPVIGPASAFADPGMPPDPPAIPGQPPTFNPTNQVPPGPNVEIDAYPEALPGVDFIGPRAYPDNVPHAVTGFVDGVIDSPFVVLAPPPATPPPAPAPGGFEPWQLDLLGVSPDNFGKIDELAP
jgi:hypothetical protein